MTNIVKVIYKILLIVLILQIIFAFENVSHAGWWSEVFETGSDFIEEGKNAGNKGTTAPSETSIRDIINNIYNILFPLGVVTTVIVGGILGIKFMIASVEDKAKIKESLVPYIVGCVVIYGAFGIWKICIEIFSIL